MKVLFVSSGNSFYGISPIVSRQGVCLEKEGINIDYFGIKGHGMTGYLKNIILLRKKIHSFRPEIIHAHYGLSAIVAFIAKERERLVVSFMGSDILGFEGEDLFDKIISKSSIILNRILINASYSHVIVKSEEMFLKLKDFEKKLSMIPNGLDMSDFDYIPKEEARNVLEIKPEEKLVLFVSNPERPEKNYGLALEAIKMCPFDVSILPVFNVPLEMLKYYYSAADVLLMTSLHEGSPNVIKEAMACNCPVVSTDVGNVRWLFGDTQGYYIARFDPKEISNKIMLGIDFRMKNLKTRGRERIMELGLDSKTVAKKIIQIYRSELV